MRISDEFGKAIANVLAKIAVPVVMETGTGEGGSAGWILGSSPETELFSIDIDPKIKWRSSRMTVFKGSSLSYPVTRDLIAVTLDMISHPLLYADGDVDFYAEECCKPCLLGGLDAGFGKYRKFDMILLDSGGVLGWLEFMHVFHKGGFDYLALDDVNHVKHYHSRQFLLSLGVPEIFYTPAQFGSSIFDMRGFYANLMSFEATATTLGW